MRFVLIVGFLQVATLESSASDPEDPQNLQQVVVLFCPGDAFFHGRLTAAQLTAMNRDADVTIYYASNFYKTISFIGATNGFSKAIIKKPGRAFVDRMDHVYKRVRESVDVEVRIHRDDDGKKVIDELNGVRVFIVDKMFDLNKSLLGLRYNKNWAQPPAAAYTELPAPWQFRMPYQSMLTGEVAMIQDWRGSDFVPSLKAEIPPDIKWADFSSDVNDKSVQLSLQNVRVLALESEDVQAYANPAKWSGRDLRIFEINDQGIDTISWSKTDARWKRDEASVGK